MLTIYRGDPTQPFVRDLLNSMFDYTRDNHPNFKLFFSLDLWAEGNAFNGVHIEKYDSIIRDFKGHPAYYTGPSGKSFFSTFSSGGLTNDNWKSWLNNWGNDIYFVPDFDDTQGFNTSAPGWWYYWGDVVDGVMSW